jgi:hypothetical protein
MMMMRSALVIWLSAVRPIQDILPEFKRCRAAFLIYVWKCSQIPVTDKIIPPLSSSKTLFIEAFKTSSKLRFAPCCFGRLHFNKNNHKHALLPPLLPVLCLVSLVLTRPTQTVTAHLDSTGHVGTQGCTSGNGTYVALNCTVTASLQSRTNP